MIVTSVLYKNVTCFPLNSEVSEDSQFDITSIKVEDPEESELKIDIPDMGGELEEEGAGALKGEEGLDDGSSTSSDHGGALWADNSQRGRQKHYILCT